MATTIKLNKEQQKAVEHTNTSLLIYAGAGAGKTRVIVQRIGHLIREKGVSPYNILAITFTNKAANEMKERVASMLEMENHGVTIRTFHSLCVLLLRRFGEKIGFDRNFSIIDDDDQVKVLKDIMTRLNMDVKALPPKEILRLISSLKSEAITAFEFKDNAAFPIHNKDKIALIYEKYQQYLLNNNCMDFDDLILHTIHLLETREDVHKHVNQKYQYIHVDEYQDTNKAQFKLLKLLGKNNYVCAVGDTDQAIYSWRGADITNINNFEEDFQEENRPVEVVKLTQNYRSTMPILEVANKLISHNENRRPKELWTDKKEGENIKLYCGSDDKEESRFIVKQIKELVSSGKCSYSDIAILYRINSLSRYLESALVNANIPYKVVGNLSFYKRKEIKDILSYMRLAVNLNDDVAYMRALTSQKRGIGAASIEKLTNVANNQNISLYTAAENGEKELGKKLASKFQKFNATLNNIKSRLHSEGVSEVVNSITDETGYLAELQKEGVTEANERIENIEELKSSLVVFIKDLNFDDLEEIGYDANNTEDILSLFVNNAMLDAVESETDQSDYVTLMSTHRAKGTEYKCVFVVAFESGLFPLEKATFIADEMEEERRLAYVAFTRAKELLYITCASRRPRKGQYMSSVPSIFVAEAMCEYIEELSITVKDYTFKNSTYKPYTNTPMKKSSIKSSDSINNDWKLGDKLEHTIFGKGVIVNVGEDLLTIAFSREHGIKKILGTHNSLKKL